MYIDDVCLYVMALAVKSASLGGLRNAVYVLQCLERGLTRKEVVEHFENDEQLVDVWLSFLLQYRWVEQVDELDEWVVTTEGKKWREDIARMLNES